MSVRAYPPSEPVRVAVPEHDLCLPVWKPVRRIGSVRIPLALGCQPTATLYRLPDGRTIWCVRLWDLDQPVKRCVPTRVLREFAHAARLEGLGAEIDRLAAAAEGP